jgi:hypothetical protein
MVAALIVPFSVTMWMIVETCQTKSLVNFKKLTHLQNLVIVMNSLAVYLGIEVSVFH